MKLRVCIIIAATLIIILCGCNTKKTLSNSPQETNSAVLPAIESLPSESIKNSSQPLATEPSASQPENTSNKSRTTEDDFNVSYNGTEINDSSSFETIAKKLGIIIGEINDNIYIKAGTQTGDWYVVEYPTKENEDLRIEYVQSEVFGTYIVRVDLHNVKTNRGIGVGDSEDALLAAYGDTVAPIDNGDDSEYYEYPLSNDQSKVDSEDKVVTFIVDKATKLITEVNINYNNNKAMSDLDIIAFD